MINHIKEMRNLGVIWRKHRLPLYPNSMTIEQKKAADIIYDSMPDNLVDKQVKRVNLS